MISSGADGMIIDVALACEVAAKINQYMLGDQWTSLRGLRVVNLCAILGRDALGRDGRVFWIPTWDRSVVPTFIFVLDERGEIIQDYDAFFIEADLYAQGGSL